MVTYNLQPFSNGQPFQPELTQAQQQKGEGKSVGKIIVTIILVLFVTGIIVVSAPIIFCFLLLAGGSLLEMLGGIVGAIIGIAIIVFLIIFSVKLFKKRNKKQ